MDLEQDQQKNLIDTTDCLEAIGVFRGWKNFLFIVVILCLLLLQASFWLVNTGYVATEQVDKASAAAAGDSEPAAEAAKAKENIKKAAEQVAAATNKPAEASPQQPQPKLANLYFKIEFKHLAWLISLVNFVLILAAILYCLTMLFSLKVLAARETRRNKPHLSSIFPFAGLSCFASALADTLAEIFCRRDLWSDVYPKRVTEFFCGPQRQRNLL